MESVRLIKTVCRTDAAAEPQRMRRKILLCLESFAFFICHEISFHGQHTETLRLLYQI